MMSIAYIFAHYFFPRSSNNHKANLLHTSTLSFLIILLLFYQISMQFFPAVSLKILGYAANISIQEVVDMTNKKRTEVGLSTLNYNAQLSAAAKAGKPQQQSSH